MVTTDVGVLDKVVALLDLYDEGTRVLEPAAAASRAGISTGTAYRLMKAMAAHGLLTQQGRGYGLGLQLLHLGNLTAVHLDLVDVARPFMARLRDECNETVELQVRVGHHRVPVHLEASTRTVRSQSQIGIPMPLHRGASSRPLTAWLDPADSLELARASAAAEGSELDEEDYLRRQAAIRERGYDWGFGERDVETAAASAPVIDRAGAVAAILVVSGTHMRFRDEDHRQGVVDGLLRAARSITEALGGTYPV